MNRLGIVTEQESQDQSASRGEQTFGGPLGDSSSPLSTPRDTLNNEVERVHVLSQLIIDLQDQLRELYASLSERYQPHLEGQSNRLALERDEAIISWGQALLGLHESGVKLELVTLDQERTSLFTGPAVSSALSAVKRAPREVSLTASTSTTGSIDDQRSSTVSPRPSEPHPSRASGPYISGSSASNAQLSESQGVDSDDSDLSAEEDPGIAEAPTVSLTQFSIDDLRKQMLKPKGWGQEDSVDLEADEGEGDEMHHQLAIEVVKRISSPTQLNALQLKEHLIELEAEVECCQRWSVFSQAVQHAVVTLVTSRLRKIQDQIGENTFDQDRIAKMFRRLTRFSSDFRPGFVHGLARDKVPEFESWRVDEEHAWQRLEELLDLKPQLPTLSPQRVEKLDQLKQLIEAESESPEFSNKLRAAVTDCINSGFPQDSPHLAKVLEPHLNHLSGKRFKKLRLAASR